MRAITQRQHDYLELALQGLSNREIAARLIVSLQTTRNQLYSAYKALPEMKQRVRLARKARAKELKQLAA